MSALSEKKEKVFKNNKLLRRVVLRLELNEMHDSFEFSVNVSIKLKFTLEEREEFLIVDCDCEPTHD